MFAKLINRCRFAVPAKLESETSPYRIRVEPSGDDATERVYYAEYLPCESGIEEAVKLTSDGKEYVILVSKSGHYCSCPDFEHRAAARNEPCRHLAAVLNVGILSPQYAPYLKQLLEKLTNGSISDQNCDERAPANDPHASAA